MSKKGDDGLVSRYKANLHWRIGQEDRSLVCRDEELCKEVDKLLSKGKIQKIPGLRGFDPLTIIAKSLNEFSSRSGGAGLEKLSRAFEVLELAALNLYLFPWRKEFKCVKMFSGTFTHFIKSALTTQQIRETFGLLGYQPSKSNEEMVLSSKKASADLLLSAACGFFTARMECQVLWSSLGPADRDVKWVLQLVQERQTGHSLQEAVENTKKMLDDAKPSQSIHFNIYLESPPSMSRFSSLEPKSSVLEKILNTDAVSVEDPRPPKASESSLESQNQADATCSYYNASVQCKDVRSCSPPPALKNHYCVRMDKPDSFLVCHSCRVIHASSCYDLNICKQTTHHIQPQLPVGGGSDIMRRHSCLTADAPVGLICHSCNSVHDVVCEYAQSRCIKSHAIEFPEAGGSEQPIPFHRCWSSDRAWPDLLCRDCQVFHFLPCADCGTCLQQHHTLRLSTTCVCGDAQCHALCRYCGKLYCQTCWFKNAMVCQCGKSA